MFIGILKATRDAALAMLIVAFAIGSSGNLLIVTRETK